MTTSLYIPVRRAYRSRLRDVDWDNLETGMYTTDHMLTCDYGEGSWKQPEIVPFGAFSLSPTTLSLHYGQTIFEGMKAFRTIDDRIHLFRPDRHYERMVRSAERMCMPPPPTDIFHEGLRRLVEVDKDWVPGQTGAALYLRPFMIATDTRFGLKVSDNYRLAIICLPAVPYFAKAVEVKIEQTYVRAVRGGTGYAKCGGNYGAAFYPTQLARQEGYDQVIWTDGVQHRYIEEIGMMNIFFVMGSTLVTPALTDSLLDGVTRDSLLTLALHKGLTVEERPVSVSELKEGLERGKVREAFGAGTAAVISPIRAIGIDGVNYPLAVVGEERTLEGSASVVVGQDRDGGAVNSPESVALVLKEELDDIRYGRKPDLFGWNNYIM